MSGKHTPGPWRFDGPTLKGPSYNIGSVNSHGTVEGKANAHLIATAPDLLEALEAVREWAVEAEEGDPYKARILKPQAWEKVRTSLAKAKGTPA